MPSSEKLSMRSITQFPAHSLVKLWVNISVKSGSPCLYLGHSSTIGTASVPAKKALSLRQPKQFTFIQVSNFLISSKDNFHFCTRKIGTQLGFSGFLYFPISP